MTEEEAKNKWCPRTSLSGAGSVGEMEWHTNRPTFADVEAKGFDLCVGSACMAWRWDTENHLRGGGVHEISSDTSGYCGLAGKP